MEFDEVMDNAAPTIEDAFEVGFDEGFDPDFEGLSDTDGDDLEIGVARTSKDDQEAGSEDAANAGSAESSLEDDADDVADSKDSADADSSDDSKDGGSDAQGAQDKPIFVLRHMGQSFSVNQEDMVALAQKGLDYDRIRTQRDQMMNDPTLAELDLFAQMNGTSRLELIQSMIAAYQEQSVVARSNQLVQQGYDENAAYQIASLEMQNQMAQRRQMVSQNQARAQQNQQMVEQRQKEQEHQVRIAQFSRLKEAFPELREKSFSDLPKSVQEAILNGLTPLEAYQGFVLSENKRIASESKRQVEIMRNNQAVREKSTGSVKSSKAPKVKDAFELGFDGDDNDPDY